MTLVTKKVFKRVHLNGTVMIEVPRGTKLTITPYYAAGAWKVTGGEKLFHVNNTEYRQLVGEVR